MSDTTSPLSHLEAGRQASEKVLPNPASAMALTSVDRLESSHIKRRLG